MSNLRDKAEKIYRNDYTNTENLSDIELHKLIEELQIHQIELQVQNEELRASRIDLENAQKKYFNLFDLAPVGYLIIDSKAIIEESNLKAAELFGRRKDYIRNHPLVSLLDAPYMKIFYDYFEFVKINQTNQVCELKITRENKSKDIELKISPYFNETYLAVLTNITERKKSEESLIESERKFKEIINQINDGIIVFDEQGKIIVWNRGSEKIFGIKTDDALNYNIIDIQYQFSLPHSKNKATIKNQIQEIINFKNPELYNSIADSEILAPYSNHPINLQSIVFPITFNNFNLFCSVYRDTTEIKRFENQLIKLNADKDRFISILAHDLRSPFNAILGFLSLLSDNINEYDIDKIKTQIDLINKTAINTFNLLEDLLSWARIQSGKFLFKPKNLVLENIYNDIFESLNTNAQAKNISLNYFEKERIVVFADNDMLKTVLRNLISNAIKFTNKGGKVDVHAIQNSASISVSVTDNGIGMGNEISSKLFDTSQMITTKGIANETGTGLGLLLCKEFIEKHEGKIWVESHPGAGSNFIFTIPIK